MPVVTTSVTVGPVTTTTYTINVTIDKVKNPPRCRLYPLFNIGASPSLGSTGGGTLTAVQYKDSNLVPNTPSTGTLRAYAVSPADGYGGRLSPLNNASTIVTTTGGVIPTSQCVIWGEGYTKGQSSANNIYRIFAPQPGLIKVMCCIEADLGYPFGTIRLIYSPRNGLRISAATPPAGWVRNSERRNASGSHGTDSAEVYALGSQMINDMWSGVLSDDGSVWGRNVGYTDTTLPTFSLNVPDLDNTYLYGWNYQTSTVMRSNLTLKGRWRRVRHDDHGTYNPLSGAYLGAAFNVPFTDLAPTAQQPIFSVAYGTTLNAPTLPTNEYCGLFLQLVATSDYINSSGVTITSTQSYGDYAVFNMQGSTVVQISRPYQPPTHWPWDVKLVGQGPDDSTVRWVRHAGYRPLASAIPPKLAETSVAPILSRVGKIIVLRGGKEPYTGAPIQITASTPACTGVVYTTDPTLSNASAMQATMAIRVVSMEWGVEWSTTSNLIESPEWTAASGGSQTGVYRQVYQSQYLNGTSYLAGPGVLTTDICALQNNANGAAGNVAITTTTGYARGMQYGDVSLPARGSIWLDQNPTDTKKIVISDGIVKKTFEFDSNSAVVAGNILVTIGASIDATIANLIAAINSSGLTITASVPTITDLKVEITLCRYIGQSGGWRKSADQWILAAP